MSESRFDAIEQADARLSRSFVAAVGALAATILWVLFLAGPGEATETSATSLVLMAVQFACYIWYAVAAGGAAKVLSDTGWKYIAWILAAPLLARLPIPLLSHLILASPLAIKLLLGSRLQAAIRREGIASLHEYV